MAKSFRHRWTKFTGAAKIYPMSNASKTPARKRATGKTELVDWYDRPQYFDMIFRDETADEVRFFEAAFERFAKGPVKRVFEPGCGSGRLVAAMAAKGYQVAGLDLNDSMLAYLRQRLKRRGLDATLYAGDMARLDEAGVSGTFDASFNTFNTFRHLLDEATAVAHLRQVADRVRLGGVYILGFHIIPLDAFEVETERWSAKHGGTTVKMTLTARDPNRRRRLETVCVDIRARRATGKVEKLRSEFDLRLYTVPQAKKLFATVNDVWEIAEIFDFHYDIDEPREFDDDLTDALFILRRR